MSEGRHYQDIAHERVGAEDLADLGPRFVGERGIGDEQGEALVGA